MAKGFKKRTSDQMIELIGDKKAKAKDKIKWAEALIKLCDKQTEEIQARIEARQEKARQEKERQEKIAEHREAIKKLRAGKEID